MILRQKLDTQDERRRIFEDKSRKRFARVSPKLEMSLLNIALPTIMDEFHNVYNNTGYITIDNILGNLLPVYDRDGTFSELISKTEENFIRMLCDTMNTPIGAVRNEKMRELNELRSQLAQYYVELYCQLEQPGQPLPQDPQQMQADLEGLLRGTISAFVFNTLKSRGLIHEDTKPGQLYDSISINSLAVNPHPR